MADRKVLLLIPHLRIHNANALSSPYTIGFPAMTAWLGGVHALQRKCQAKGIAINFDAVAVVSHDCQLQTYKGDNDFVSSIVSTGNPLDKTGARPAFIEEPRIHLEVSLLIECKGLLEDDVEERFKTHITRILHSMKFASGDIQDFHEPEFIAIEDGVPEDVNRVSRQLMPGYVLVERRDLMVEAMEEGQDALDAMIDYLAIHHRSEAIDNADNAATITKGRWQSYRKATGWIVPIATGFQGMTALGIAKNQRDETTPHRFAESIVTLGEFKMPHHFSYIEDMLWRYHFDEATKLYQCVQGDEHLIQEN